MTLGVESTNPTATPPTKLTQMVHIDMSVAGPLIEEAEKMGLTFREIIKLKLDHSEAKGGFTVTTAATTKKDDEMQHISYVKVLPTRDEAAEVFMQNIAEPHAQIIRDNSVDTGFTPFDHLISQLALIADQGNTSYCNVGDLPHLMNTGPEPVTPNGPTALLGADQSSCDWCHKVFTAEQGRRGQRFCTNECGLAHKADVLKTMRLERESRGGRPATIAAPPATMVPST